MDTLSSRHFRFADFELDGAKRLLLRRGEPVVLNSKSFDLLVALLEGHGEVLGKDELLERVWPGQIIEEGNLTVQISNLRKIFGERKDQHKFIVTVPGRGYSFVADVTNGNDRDVIIESHSRSRIVVEEEIREIEDKTIASKRMSLRGIAIAGAVAVLVIGVLAYWLYQRSDRGQSFAAAWVNPTQPLKPRQLTANGKVAFAALAPDGSHFAYTVGQTDAPSLWYAHTNGKQQLQIRPQEHVTYHGLTFAPDGTEIYYVASDEKERQGALFRMPVLGGPSQKVLTNIESPVTFSPDGKKLAFVRHAPKRKITFLVVADTANGANERVLATRPLEKRFNLRGASWSPDGSVIAVGAVAGTALVDEEVALVNVADGTVERFGPQTFQVVRRVAWLRDGSGLFVNAVEKDIWDDRHLWLIEYPGGNARKVTQDLFHYGMFSLSVSNDGEKILSVSSTKICNIFVSPAGEITQANKISGNLLGKLPGIEGMTWTPDGKIVYGLFFDNNQAFWIMDADGSNARQLTSSGSLDRYPHVTKDNRYVVFNSTRGEGIWRIGLDGGNLKQLTVDGGRRPSVTPDGRWVFYGNRGEDGIVSVWKVSIDGGESVRVTYKPSGYVSVSPDGKMFACSYNSAEGEKNQLAVFPINGGDPLHMFDLPPKANLSVGIRWTPDGRSLVYRDHGPSLWQQRMTGGEPEKILEYPDEIIYSFDWSHDGKLFAVAHGEDVRDVVLISNKWNGDE